MADARFIYVSGPDDYLVSRLASPLWDGLKQGVEDDFSIEVINGQAGKLEEAEQAVNQFRQAVETMGLFGGRRVVWLKSVTFFGDNQIGKTEGAARLCEDLQEILERINPAEVGVLITATPVDRRRKFAKWLEGAGDYHPAGGADAKGGAEALAALLAEEMKALGVSIARDAAVSLLSKVNGNTRLLIEESRKLATYLGEDGGEVTARLVEELVPNFGEGDFFESTEAFFSRDLRWTLDALGRHFFSGNDARPVISSLQNRNRLLVQLRSLIDGGEIQASGRGIGEPGFKQAADKYAAFYAGANDKSGFNVFTQNLWYMGKLVGAGRLPNLKQLVDHQLEFIRAFEEIVERPSEQEAVLRDMAIRCLSA